MIGGHGNGRWAAMEEVLLCFVHPIVDEHYDMISSHLALLKLLTFFLHTR
jgi:hypothetical protein